MAKVGGSSFGDKIGGVLGGIRDKIGGKVIDNYAYFPGEKHLIELIDGKLTMHAFSGPGTNVPERLKLLEAGKIRVVNGVDQASKKHDLIYYDISQNKSMTDEQKADTIWKADDVFSKETAGVKDSKIMGALASQAMQAKKYAEKMGLHDVKKWTKS